MRVTTHKEWRARIDRALQELKDEGAESTREDRGVSSEAREPRRGASTRE
jgi:hypothetical protein